MIAVIRQVCTLVAISIALVACGSGPEKQWYKPGANYTISEFQHDQKECTKNDVLDEECMRERGWVTLSADTDKSPPPMKGGPQMENRPRYAPK
jgi:hypothetical protein